MKNLIVIALLLFAFSNVNAQFSREEAMEIVISEIIGIDTLSSIDLYSMYDKAYYHDTLQLSYFMGYYIYSYEEQWVFFIDDMPVANWAHDTRFVFFNSNNGDYIVEENYWPPYPYFEDHILFFGQWEWYFEQEYSREEAIEIIINEVIGPDSLEIKQFFSRKEKMNFGDTLWMQQQDYYYFCPFYEQWVFFVDDMPLAYWAHPCRVIFFKVSSGVYTIHEDEWPPDPWLEDFNLFLEEWDWITSVDVSGNVNHKSELTIFPNPCKNEISLQCNIDTGLKRDIIITDLTGKTIKNISLEISTDYIKVNTSHINSGLYFINIFEQGRLIHQEKFVKVN